MAETKATKKTAVYFVGSKRYTPEELKKLADSGNETAKKVLGEK